MTIHLPKDVESAINAAVVSGQFASADDMVAKLVSDYARSHRVQPTVWTPQAGGDDSPDPLLGSMSDHAELMDEIVEDAMRNRERQPWRLPAGE